jgi:predicted transcriptional regulator
MPEYKKQHSEITCDFSTNRLKILRQKRLFTNDKLVNRQYGIYYLSKIKMNMCVG